MKSITILFASAAMASTAMAGLLDGYTSVNTYYLPDIPEASGVTYNWDTGTLFAVGDEGNELVEISKTGQKLGGMIFEHSGSRETRAVDDAEGIAYLGNGKFMIADERDNMGRITTYQNGATRTLTELSASSYSFAAPGGNSELEGVAFDPLTNSVWGVKEIDSMKIYNMTGIPELTGDAANISVTEPFKGLALNRIALNYGIKSLSDIYVVAASEAYESSGSILLLARDQQMILEVGRNGSVISTLDFSAFGRPTVEGITMDGQGNIYLVAEGLGPAYLGTDGAKSALYVLSTVPEPSTYGLVIAALLGGIAYRRFRNRSESV